MIPNHPLFRKAEPYLLPLIIILVGVGAFGLGRLSAGQPHTALRVLYPGVPEAEPLANTAAVAGAAKAQAPAPAAQGPYVASKNGTKYYLPSCSGAKRIKEENKVYFASKALAVAAGYEPALNCPGL